MKLSEQKDEPKLEAKTNRTSSAEKKTAPVVIDQPVSAEKEELQSLAELQERADAIDKVLTKNGPPELDLRSG